MKSLTKSIKKILEDNKAERISVIDVTDKSSVTDVMFIVSGRSSRHVQAIADNLVDKLKEKKIRPLGVEGYNQSQWILIDFGDLLVNVMHPEAREFYSLEKLWDENLNNELGLN